jgi:hypothetical protein
LGRISAERADDDDEEEAMVKTEVDDGTTKALAVPAARRMKAAESFMVDLFRWTSS